MSELSDFYDNLMSAVSDDDGDRIRALIDPSFTMYNDQSMPYGGVYHGPDGFLGMIRVVWATWRDTKVENLYQLEDTTGDNLNLVMKLGGYPGKCDDWTEVIVNELWTVRHGKAVEARIWFWDATRLSKLILDGKA
jgi:hypothetical protein